MKREYRTLHSPVGNTLGKVRMIVARSKMARYDVYTLIKIGIDRQGLLLPLPQCLQEILHSEASENLEGACTAART